MNRNHRPEDFGEIEYAEKTTAYTTKRFKKVNVLIFIVCLLLAFVFWCYALYIDDPIIEKSITLNFTLEGGQSNEFLLPATKKVIVYGEKSFLENINSITIKVNRSNFTEYNEDTYITIDYPDNIGSNTKQVNLQLNFIPN